MATDCLWLKQRPLTGSEAWGSWADTVGATRAEFCQRQAEPTSSRDGTCLEQVCLGLWPGKDSRLLGSCSGSVTH